MTLPRLLWLLLPVGPLVAAFGACSVTSVDGSGYGGSGTVAVSSGSVGAGGLTVGTGGASAGHLAAQCQSDDDCGGNLVCLGPGGTGSAFGGGAPGGFCTKDCTADADCVEQGGICLQPDPKKTGLCTLACTLGPPISGVAGLFQQPSPAKCRGREDVRCWANTPTTGVCLPTCGEDSQCPGGHCDPRTAVCVSAPSTGDPTGAACDAGAAPTTCAGECILFTNGVAMCSEPCVLGGASSQSPDCGGAEQGLCAFHPTGNGAGDTGYCTPACTHQGDCQTPYLWCFGVAGLTEVIHEGYCFAAAACKNGQSDCTPPGDAGTNVPAYVCTDTPAGPLCLDPMFPLYVGDAGTGDAGDDGKSDAGQGDASPGDAEPPDAGPGDAGYPDAEGDAGDAGDAG